MTAIPAPRRARAIRAACLTALTAVCALAGTAPPLVAQTGDIAASRVFPVFGPRLAGENVLWTVPRRDRGYVVKRGAPTANGAERVLTTVGGRFSRATLSWVASPELLLVEQTVATVDPPPEGGSVKRLGIARVLPGGGLESLRPGSFRRTFGNFDVDGSIAVFPANESSDAAIVRDFSRDRSTALRIDGTAPGLRIAGRYIAWNAEKAVVVFDYVAMSEIYRVARPVRGGLVDLQPDGKVALAYQTAAGPPSERGVGWASPSEPFLHPLPASSAEGFAGVQLRNDVIVFERPSGNALKETRPGDLLTVPLNGGESKVLARSVENATGLSTDLLFDFDGSRVAWLDRTCGGARVRVALLSDLILRPRRAPTRRCRLRFASRPQLTRQGDLRFRVSCVGFRRDCKVLGATLHLARSYRVGRKWLRRGTRLSAKRRRIGGLSSVGRFRISPQSTRLLRRPGSVRLRLTVRMGDPDTVVRRRATVAIR